MDKILALADNILALLDKSDLLETEKRRALRVVDDILMDRTNRNHQSLAARRGAGAPSAERERGPQDRGRRSLMSGTFTQSELHRLHLGLFRAMNGRVAKADVEAMIDWAKEARLNADLLELVLEGYMDPYVNESGELAFQPTAKGLESSRASRLERMSS